MSATPVISPDEAAKIIGITKQSVIEAYHKQLIKGYKMGQGLRSPLALYRESVEAYAQQRQQRLARLKARKHTT